MTSSVESQSNGLKSTLKIFVTCLVIAYGLSFFHGRAITIVRAFALLTAYPIFIWLYWNCATLGRSRIPGRYKTWFSFLVVATAWVLMCLFFGDGTNPGSTNLEAMELLDYGLFVLVLFAIARAAANHVQMSSRMQLYFVAIMFAAFLSLLTISGQHMSDDYENSSAYEATEPPYSPARRDRAFLHFLLYSGACMIGIATAGFKPRLFLSKMRNSEVPKV